MLITILLKKLGFRVVLTFILLKLMENTRIPTTTMKLKNKTSIIKTVAGELVLMLELHCLIKLIGKLGFLIEARKKVRKAIGKVDFLPTLLLVKIY